jgi:hypothetical protein
MAATWIRKSGVTGDPVASSHAIVRVMSDGEYVMP